MFSVNNNNDNNHQNSPDKEEVEIEMTEIPINDPSESHQQSGIDILDIRNYYNMKSNIKFMDIVEYLYKIKLVIILGVIFSFILSMFYLLLESWHNMQLQAWFTIILTVCCVLLLIGNILPPPFIFIGATSICYAIGLINTEQALEGFGNSSIVLIALLFVIAKTVEKSDILKYAVKYILRHPKTLIKAQVRLLIPVIITSGFVNDTPLVALMIPVVKNWCNICGFYASQLLMPLSYAAIIGGTCTLIGTSSNLIVLGLVVQMFPHFRIGFFEIAIVGIPCCIVAFLYMILFAQYLLPKNSSNDNNLPSGIISPDDESHSSSEEFREYNVSMVILKNSTLIGKTNETSGLKNLKSLKILKVIRTVIDEENGNEYEETPQIDEELTFHKGDIIFFQGLIDDIYILYQYDGLAPATSQLSKVTGRDRILVEVVLAAHSPHIGKTISETKFRTKYNAVIIAVHRHGFQLTQRIRDIQLEVGDTLLLETTKEFLNYHQHDSNFALVSEFSRGESIARSNVSFHMIFVFVSGGILILLNAFAIFSLLQLALSAICLYVLFGLISWRDALSALQVDSLLLMASAFGLRNALEVSGAADVIANSLLYVFSLGGRIGVVFGLFCTTAFLGAVISNITAITLIFPIAIAFAFSSGISLKCITFTLMMAGSCNFVTPVSFQTNLMVMGPGRYTTMNYLIFGLPLTILLAFTSVIIIFLVWVDDFDPIYYDLYSYLPPVRKLL